jgi:hypothetical protein
MTRDFNKQRRDDSRPSFRDRSSSNRGEERSSNPARPRLNRETVDRAWESGAQHQHADYRTRSNNGQPTRNNWRNNQQPSGYSSSSQNGHGGNRPYNTNRQEQNRDNSHGFGRTSEDSYGPRNPRARSFGPNNTIGRQQYDNARPGERSHYDNTRPGSNHRPYDNQRPGGERPYSPGARPDYRHDNNRPGNRDERFQGQDRGRDNRRPDFERNERPYSNERRGPGGHYNQRSGPDTRNPRWQSRTWTREASPEERQEHSSRASDNEQFEGDYERFNNANRPAQRDTSNRGSRPEGNTFRSRPVERKHDAEEPAQERHVTRLPDGRVIKGPRPIQRKEARFWSEVADDTEGLIGHIPAENKEVDEAQSVEVDGATPDTEDKPSKKPRARSASATVRSRKTGEAKEKTRGPKGPRPSQRGFKWPTT